MVKTKLMEAVLELELNGCKFTQVWQIRSFERPVFDVKESIQSIRQINKWLECLGSLKCLRIEEGVGSKRRECAIEQSHIDTMLNDICSKDSLYWRYFK